MLQTGLHIHDHNIVSVQDQVIDDPSEHNMLRTYTAASSCLHCSQNKKLYTVYLFRVCIRNIADLRIQCIELIILSGPCSFFNEFSHFSNGDYRIQGFFVKPQSQSKIGIRVYICCENVFSFVSIKPGKSCGKSGLSNAAFSCNRYFHVIHLS